VLIFAPRGHAPAHAVEPSRGIEPQKA
jgi:hypothetical protein